MATGKQIQSTGQAGEYLVAAEICRRGFIASTFTGNVPDYDIVAVNENGKILPIQVKAIRGKSWQFNAGKFLDIELKGTQQTVRKSLNEPIKDLICVFVILRQYGDDEFFIFTWKDLRSIIKKNYPSPRVRPKNPKSLHCAPPLQ